MPEMDAGQAAKTAILHPRFPLDRLVEAVLPFVGSFVLQSDYYDILDRLRPEGMAILAFASERLRRDVVDTLWFDLNDERRDARALAILQAAEERTPRALVGDYAEMCSVLQDCLDGMADRLSAMERLEAACKLARLASLSSPASVDA